MDDVVVPDAVEAVIGWRAWVVQPGPVLASVVHHAIWLPCKRFEANCLKGHSVPDRKCRCGVYAASTREHLGEMSYPEYDLAIGHVVVVGEVALWGGLISGDKGLRAEFAYPIRLLLPFEAWRLAGPLQDDYRVQVQLANTFRLAED